MQLDLTLKKIAEVVDGETSLDPLFLVQKISSLEQAGPNDLAILFDPEENSVFPATSLETIEKCKAGIILASKSVVASKQYLIVKDPLAAYQKITSLLFSKAPLIHSSASISPKAQIATGCNIEAFSIIEENTIIDENSSIGSNCFIARDCTIGKNVKINSGVKIFERCIIGDNTIIDSCSVIGCDGFGYRASRTGLNKIPHIGIVRIGKNVEIGANSCIDRATFEETIIGDGAKIDNLVNIAHNVKIGAHTVILAQTAIAGSVEIGIGCQIGGQVVVKDHVKIGNGVKIVAKSGVMKNIADGEIVAGLPTMPFQKWKRLVITLSNIHEINLQIQQLKQFLNKYNNPKPRWWHKIIKKFFIK